MNDLIQLYLDNNHTTDKWGESVITHSYLAVYGEIFKRLKDNKNKILEIGIYKGDSLNLWAEYFTQSTIYGMDQHIDQVDIPLHSNVRVIGDMDAYSEWAVKFLNNLGKFNVIIDDGSHYLFHQKFVIDHYCDLLTDDGILIIEDVNHNVDVESNVRFIDMLMGYFREDLKPFTYKVDNRHVNNNMADSLVILDKNGKNRTDM